MKKHNKTFNSVTSITTKIKSTAHVMPSKDMEITSFSSALFADNYKYAEKILGQIVLREQKDKDEAIEVIYNKLNHLFNLKLNVHDEKFKQISNLWKRGIEKGLLNDENDIDGISRALKTTILLLLNDQQLFKTWLSNQKLNNDALHEVAEQLLRYVHLKDAWREFQDKNLKKLNPNYINKDGRKFIEIAFIFGPESLCLDMIEKSKSIDDNTLTCIMTRIQPTSINFLNKLAEKTCGKEVFIERAFKAYEKNIQKQCGDLNWSLGGIENGLKYLGLSDGNKIIAPLLKEMWIEIQVEKSKKEIQENIEKQKNLKTFKNSSRKI